MMTHEVFFFFDLLSCRVLCCEVYGAVRCGVVLRCCGLCSVALRVLCVCRCCVLYATTLKLHLILKPCSFRLTHFV